MAELQPLRTEPAASWRWHKRALVSLIAAFMAVAGAAMADGPRLTLTFSYIGAILFGTAFVFLLLGLRADKDAAAAQAKPDSNGEEDD